jgi:hypothetical protein
VAVPVSVYDELGKSEARFLVAPGHERPERDRVLRESPAYKIVAGL